MADNRRDLLDQKQEVTARISETTRYVGFGLLAVYYALRTAGAPVFASPDGYQRPCCNNFRELTNNPSTALRHRPL